MMDHLMILLIVEEVDYENNSIKVSVVFLENQHQLIWY